MIRNIFLDRSYTSVKRKSNSEIPRRSVGFRIFLDRADKPNSVVDDHLSGPVITDKLERHSPISQRTALHGDKDLLVAFPSRDGRIPRGNSRPFGVDVSVGTSRLATCGRYPLPFCRPCGRPVFGLSSRISFRHARGRLAWSASIIPHLKQQRARCHLTV